MFFYSCNTTKQDDTSSEIAEDTTQTNVPDKSLVGMIDGSIYCLPSPYEIMNHLKSLDLPYEQSLPNSVMNLNLYESSFKKLLNMGVYGIDISYMSLYEQIADALNYFATLKALANQVELATVFDATTMERLENNMENKDSLLIILTRKFQDSDQLLKNEKQKAEASLILTGCWVESLYYLTQIEKIKHNDITVQKIAEHKFIAETILNILRPYYNKSAEYTNLIKEIVDICYEFDGITYEYTYQEPTTIANQHLTIINSNSKLIILPEHIQLITSKIEKLRNEIIK